MNTLTDMLANPAVQAAVISALSHVVVWAAKKVPTLVNSLPGGYSSAKRALALKLLKALGTVDAPAAPAAPEAPKSDLNAPH